MATKKVAGSRFARKPRSSAVHPSVAPSVNSAQGLDANHLLATQPISGSSGSPAGKTSRMRPELSFLAKRIIQLRRAKGISQEELAYRAELSRNGMGSIEQGRGWPRINTLLRISEALDTTVEELVKSNFD